MLYVDWRDLPATMSDLRDPLLESKTISNDLETVHLNPCSVTRHITAYMSLPSSNVLLLWLHFVGECWDSGSEI